MKIIYVENDWIKLSENYIKRSSFKLRNPRELEKAWKYLNFDVSKNFLSILSYNIFIPSGNFVDCNDNTQNFLIY